MEQHYGGPVWHASVALVAFDMQPERLRTQALAALAGVGDASLGEWEEWTGRAYHVRRRLSASESSVVGPVIDVRGLPEGLRRVANMTPYLPVGVPPVEV